MDLSDYQCEKLSLLKARNERIKDQDYRMNKIEERLKKLEWDNVEKNTTAAAESPLIPSNEEVKKLLTTLLTTSFASSSAFEEILNEFLTFTKITEKRLERLENNIIDMNWNIKKLEGQTNKPERHY